MMADVGLKRLHVQVPAGLLRGLDAWRREQRDLPTRSEAIRRLVSAGVGKRAPRSARTLRPGRSAAAAHLL
jgi:metal-responsive CopG/Arc/MetJ family transcriptional regulator